jgi:S-adenosylmethionine-dependent methyltransferase
MNRVTHPRLTGRAAFLPDRPCRIVDVGAGSGQQALPLARAGHEVTLVEPSPIMVEQAQLAIEACDADVRRRVTVVRADAEAAVSLLPGEFDAVLCHGVLMYLPDPAPVLAALARLCRPGGIVSVLTKNSGALAMRHGLQADFATALACFEAEDSIGWLGVRTRGDTLDGLTRLLAAHDVMVEEWFGVGVFSDHRSDLDALDESGYRLLEQAELVAARTDPYRAVARLIHVVGRRAAR